MNLNKSITALSSEGATLAKIIATFSVILTHSFKIFRFMGVEESEVFYLRGFHAFAACGVPIFFLLSGYFLVFKDTWDYKRNLQKKVKSLVIPYCLFMLVYTIISCLGALVLPGFFDDFRTFTAHDWLMHLVGIPFFAAPSYYGPLWFVRELIVFNVLSIILVPAVKKIPNYILIPVMLGVYFLPIQQTIRYSIPFFIMGMNFGFKKRIPVLSRLISIITVLLVGFFAPIVFDGALSWKVSVLFMAFSVLALSEKMITRDSVKRMAQSAISLSFPIYLLHEYPITTLMRLLALMHISIPKAIVAFFIAPFLVIGICVPVIIIWRRLLPKTFALFTGGR